MSKLLVIKANPKPTELSVGLTVGEAFVNAYRETHPEDTITEVKLFERFVPEVDGNMLAAWGALAQGKTFADLSREQQAQLKASNELLEEFMAHDKYVFITPMWNLMFPARLKSYIDALCVAGKTFRYTANGPEGLLKDKKAFHINASGGFHQGAYGDKYLRGILNFLGIEDIGSLFVEGHAFEPARAEEILENGKTQAADVGRRF